MDGGQGSGSDVSRFAEVYTHGPYQDYLVDDHRLGTRHATLLELVQPAGQYNTPGTDDMVLGWVPAPRVSARMDFGAGRFAFSSGSQRLFLSPPRAPSRVVVDQDHKVTLLAIPSGLVAETFEASFATPLAGLEPLFAGGFSDPLVTAALEALRQDASARGPARRLFEDSVLAALLAALAWRAGAGPTQWAYRGGLSPAQLRRAEEILASNPGAPLSLAHVAEAVGRSRYHLVRAFRRSTGLTPFQWRLARRMDHARALLSEGKRPLTEVAAAVGYDNLQAFSRAFRKAHGIAPSQWRAAQL